MDNAVVLRILTITFAAFAYFSAVRLHLVKGIVDANKDLEESGPTLKNLTGKWRKQAACDRVAVAELALVFAFWSILCRRVVDFQGVQGDWDLTLVIGALGFGTFIWSLQFILFHLCPWFRTEKEEIRPKIKRFKNLFWWDQAAERKWLDDLISVNDVQKTRIQIYREKWIEERVVELTNRRRNEAEMAAQMSGEKYQELRDQYFDSLQKLGESFLKCCQDLDFEDDAKETIDKLKNLLDNNGLKQNLKD